MTGLCGDEVVVGGNGNDSTIRCRNNFIGFGELIVGAADDRQAAVTRWRAGSTHEAATAAAAVEVIASTATCTAAVAATTAAAASTAAIGACPIAAAARCRWLALAIGALAACYYQPASARSCGEGVADRRCFSHSTTRAIFPSSAANSSAAIGRIHTAAVATTHCLISEEGRAAAAARHH